MLWFPQKLCLCITFIQTFLRFFYFSLPSFLFLFSCTASKKACRYVIVREITQFSYQCFPIYMYEKTCGRNIIECFICIRSYNTNILLCKEITCAWVNPVWHYMHKKRHFIHSQKCVTVICAIHWNVLFVGYSIANRYMICLNNSLVC